MENKNLIMILIAIIVVLAAVLGVMFLQSTNQKQPSKLIITSDNEQDEGGELTIKLIDSNKTPISKEIVNITITNNKGKIMVDDVIKTDAKGNGKYHLDLKKGEYSVNVSYGGNENYTGSNTTQKLIIKENAHTEQITQSSSSDDDYVYGTGAGASNDPNIHWKRNIKTGYIEYYDENTGRSWGGYNIA